MDGQGCRAAWLPDWFLVRRCGGCWFPLGAGSLAYPGSDRDDDASQYTIDTIAEAAK